MYSNKAGMKTRNNTTIRQNNRGNAAQEVYLKSDAADVEKSACLSFPPLFLGTVFLCVFIPALLLYLYLLQVHPYVN